MTNSDLRGRIPLLLAFSAFLLVPSFDTALKYFGPVGVIVYFATGTLSVITLYRLFFPIFFFSISERTSDRMAIALLLMLALLAMYMWPIANSGRFGSGSDADDALMIAAGELAYGRYPYYVTTYLGNMIGPMPGSILLALPFALTGTIPLQNVLWIGGLFFTYRYFEKSSTAALALLGAVLLFSPTVLQNIATGADYVSNSIFVMVFMWILVRSAAVDRSRLQVKGVIGALLLGIGLASRSTFFLLMPLLFSVLAQNAGWKNAVRYLSISAIVFLAITVPFWLYDPSGFAPLHVQAVKLGAVESVLPYARYILPLSAGSLSIALAFRRMPHDCARFFLNCAIVQLFILIFTAVLYSLRLQRLDLYLEQSGYGMFTLFFGTTAIWMYILQGSSEIFVPNNRGAINANLT